MNSIVDSTYRNAFDTGSGYVTFELVIGGTTYTQNQFTNLHLDASLFGEYGVGEVNLRSLTAVVADIVAVGDSVELYATYTLPSGTSYRMLFMTGVVFRNAKKAGQSDILVYDKLCLTEYTFKRAPVWSDRDMLTVTEEIAADIGVSLTARAQALIQPFNLPDPGAMSARDILVEIAKSSAGNFFMSADGELDFFSLGGNDLANYQIVTVDGNGDFQVVDFADLTDSTDVVSVDTNGDFDVIAYEDVTYTTLLWVIGADGMSYAMSEASPLTAMTFSNKNAEFDSAEHHNVYEPYVAVILSNAASSWYSPSGMSDADWEDLVATGRTMSVNVEFGSQAIADYIYSRVTQGLRFIPYAVSGNVDPALELGDLIEIEPFGDGLAYIAAAYSLDASQGRLFGEIRADGESEIETLQPYVPKVERMVRRETVERKAEIAVTQDSITAEVSRLDEEDGELRSLITQTDKEIRIDFSKGIAAAEEAAATELSEYAESVEQYIRFAGALIELGEKDSQFKAILSNTKLAFTGADGQEAAWITNNELHIKKAVIEESLTINDWVMQQESNGSFSIMYI